MAEDQDESRVFDPTPRRLEEARKKGDIPRSADLTMAVGYSGILLGCLVAGGAAISGVGALGTVLLEQADSIAPLFFSGHGAAPHGGLLQASAIVLGPFFAIPALLVLLALIAQRGLLFTPSKLQPKLSRISLVENAKQKFGPTGLMEFAKSFVKLCAYSVALGLYGRTVLDGILQTVRMEPAGAAILIARLSMEFMAIVVAIAFVVGGIDMVWQIAEHRRRNRMSYKDLRDEQKETEGDPYLKERRRQRGMEIAQDSMIADVARSNVVIVNPTHYAVALEWSSASLGAPVCVAKGVDTVAARIRNAAAEAEIPIRQDAPTARALYASVDVGQEIGRDHYIQVAAAIRFAQEVRGRARKSVL